MPLHTDLERTAHLIRQATAEPVLKIHGDTKAAYLARVYETSPSEIEWHGCCPGVICGHASRVGSTMDGLAVYRLSGVRHAHMTGALVTVGEDGTLWSSWRKTPEVLRHVPPKW